MAGSLQLRLQHEMNFKNGWTATQHKYAPSRVSPESDPISDTLSPEEPNEETSLIFEQNSATSSQSPADQQQDPLSTLSTGAPTTLPSFNQLALPSPGAEPTTLPAFAELRLPTFAEPRTVPPFAELAISLRDSPPLFHLRHLSDSARRGRALPDPADPSALTSGSAPRPSLQANTPGAAAHPDRKLPITPKLDPQWPFENKDLNVAAIQGMQLRTEGRTMPTTPMRRGEERVTSEL
ncbi:hypothetical protein AC579_5642 [Pseudocercospora musae]|uniref:Uncharacterized protein n=1 Tax=Pseudocercospora musae TaxID=113226 RepID=A0A139IEM4_9PEZI|nr:hypothetical protein AC579_5642 [Pseudocercospora musae]